MGEEIDGPTGVDVAIDQGGCAETTKQTIELGNEQIYF